MSDHARGGPHVWAASAVRRFARTTNLSIAAHRFAVHGAGSHTTALTELLSTLGARLVARDEAEVLFCTGEGVPPFRATDLAPTPGRPLLVVDTGAEPAIDLDSFGPLTPGRDGVWATATPGVFFVSGAGSPADADHDDARARIEWARMFMPTTAGIAAELAATDTVRGLRIGLSMVLEPKTAVLALAMRDAGAEVAVFSHPDETDDSVADALREDSLVVFARAGAGSAEHRDLALAFLATRPQILVDDGSHVIRLAHEAAPETLDALIGAAEETTSGLTPLRTMATEGALRIPVVAVNDARSKTLFDNRYGTGQSCVFAILDLTGLDLTGRTVVVAGYGHVGEGVARHARAFGAAVVVAEIDPVRAMQALYDGFRVAELIDAVTRADLVISATGARHTITLEVLMACARDAVIAVAGGVPQEVAIDEALAAGARRETIGHKIERFTFPTGESVVILDNGGCINVTAAEGNPIEIMDLSFAVQLSAIRYLAETAATLSPGVHPLPAAADDAVAAAALRSAGIHLDTHDARPTPTTPGDATWRTRRFDDEEQQ